MNILALVGKLGHALVSWGLGGPGDEVAAAPVAPCPIVSATPAELTAVDAAPAARTLVTAAPASHTVVEASSTCTC